MRCSSEKSGTRGRKPSSRNRQRKPAMTKLDVCVIKDCFDGMHVTLKWGMEFAQQVSDKSDFGNPLLLATVKAIENREGAPFRRSLSVRSYLPARMEDRKPSSLGRQSGDLVQLPRRAVVDEATHIVLIGNEWACLDARHRLSHVRQDRRMPPA